MDICEDLSPHREWAMETHNRDGDGDGACPHPIDTHCHP